MCFLMIHYIIIDGNMQFPKDKKNCSVFEKCFRLQKKLFLEGEPVFFVSAVQILTDGIREK